MLQHLLGNEKFLATVIAVPTLLAAGLALFLINRSRNRAIDRQFPPKPTRVTTRGEGRSLLPPPATHLHSALPPLRSEPEPTAVLAVSPVEHTRRELLPEFNNDELAAVAHWLLALSCIGDVKLNDWGPDFRYDRYTGVSEDLAYLLGYNVITDAPHDQAALDEFRDTLKASKQFEELLLDRAARIRELWWDYCSLMSPELKQCFEQYQPTAWFFDFLQVAHAARLGDDKLPLRSVGLSPQDIKVSQLVLAANFMLAFKGYGLLGLPEEYHEFTNEAEYRTFLDDLATLMEAVDTTQDYITRPELLIWYLMHASRYGLYDLIIAHLGYIISVRDRYWLLSETEQFRHMIPFLPSRETFQALQQIRD